VPFGKLKLWERTNCLVIEAPYYGRTTSFRLYAAHPLSETEYPAALWPHCEAGRPEDDPIPF